MTAPQLSPAWQDVLDRISARRSSPVLMPGAIQALLVLAEEGQVRDGEVHLADFERVFTQVMANIDPAKKSQAWRPFYHLSVGVRLWSLQNAGAPASFADLRKGKPAGASSLRTRVDTAQVREDLIGDLLLPETRALIYARTSGMMPSIESGVG